MIDLASERIVSLTEASKLSPGRPHVSTLVRWWRQGVRGVKLETLLCGGKRFTSQEALQRFFERTTAAADGLTTSPSDSGRNNIDAAEHKLASDGI